MKISGIINKIVREKNALSLAANVSVAAFRFFSFMILARYLTKDAFGQWMLFLTATGLVEMIRLGITRVALIRFLSGADGEEKAGLIGTNWMIGFFTSVFFAILLLAILALFPQPIDRSGYYYFFAFYPLLGIINLPVYNALSILQSQQRFGAILFLRSFNASLFLLFVITNSLFLQLGLLEIVLAYIIISFIASVAAIVKGWDGIKYIRHSTLKYAKTLLNFGKYSLGTLIGSNLLKNADTIIIGLSPMGTEAVALYSIPLKLTELLEIPLRSFIATAYPKMSKASIKQNMQEVRSLFYTYAGAITFLFVPVAIVCIVLAPLFVLILGGEKYLETQTTVYIFQLFAIYGLFLPFDRFTGVSLDSLNVPRKNFYKILVMAGLNIIGDVIAIFIFKSLILVAVVTILFTVIGSIIGYLYLNQTMPVRLKDIYYGGYNFYSGSIKKLMSRG